MQLKIETLDPQKHDRTNFDCGNTALNLFLKQTAAQLMKKDQARTYLATDGSGKIYGYYTLTLTNLELFSLPENLQKRHKTATTAGLLARLAVDKHYQKKGLGGMLLRSALEQLYNASNIIGFPIIFVDVKDGVAQFYEYFGFQKSANINNRYYLSIKQLKATIDACESESV